MTVPPIALPSDILRHRYVGKVRSGQKVRLVRLPRLPIKTAFNTIRPGKGHHGGRYRPFAATGATIQVTAAAACTTGGTVGDLFNEGCELTIQAANMSGWSGSDSYQYYVVPPNSTTATEIGGSGGGCSPTTDPWTAGSPPSCASASTTLSQQGTYAFLVYDTTARVFAAAIYVNAGQVFNIEIFQDAFHTQQAYQFNINSSTAAYVYLANVAPSDHYVVYVESTGVNVYCAYLAPTGTVNGSTPRPTGSPGKLLCNPATSNVTGVQAPSGSLSLTWQFASTLEAGTYSVLVYDQDANETMGQVQVSLTSSSGVSILTSGSATGANNPSPGPNNASPSNETILAWDSASDQSVGGIVGTIQESIPGSTYRWTITNPEGRVMATSAPVVVPTPSATPSPQTFAFSSFTIAPGQYPSNYWAIELYDTINKTIEASQSFQLLGYHVTTQFVSSGSVVSSLNFGTGNTNTQTADLKFTNDSDTVYNSQGDSFGQGSNPAIEFTTGDYRTMNESFTPPTAGETGCSDACGVTFELPGTSTCSNFHNATGCSATVTDSSGNSWTATEWCSTSTPASPAYNDLCVMQLKPSAYGQVLSPGAYIDISSISWTNQKNFACASTSCYAVTSVLPTHGLSWSQTNNLSDPVAWTAVSFGNENPGHSPSATVKFDYVGASPSPPALVTQGTTPWTEAHYYQSNFTRAAYQRSTPWSTSRSNVAEFTISNTSTNNTIVGPTPSPNASSSPGLAIELPASITPSQVSIDPTNTSTWVRVTCTSSFGAQYLCLAGPEIGPGTSTTLLLDFPVSVSSFTFTDMTVEAWDTYTKDLEFFTVSNDGTTESTIDGCTDCSGEPTGGVDSIGIGAYSLNSGLMSAVFSPSTVGSGASPTDLSITFQNATTSSDPNPDAIDAIVIVSSPPPAGETISDYAVSGTPTMKRSDGTSWNWLGTVSATSPSNTNEYWFGVCPSGTTNWGTLSGGPPQPAGMSTPLSSQYTALATCGTTEHNSLWNDSSNSTGTIDLNLAGPLASGAHTFYLYAHGANGGGWSAAKTITLNVASESATAGFVSVGSTCPGTAVASNKTPTVTSTSNCYIYTIKNGSSGSTKITAPTITIPAFDTSGLSANAWSVSSVELGTYSGGTFTQGSGNSQYGCTVTTTNPNPGVTNGAITISGCTSFSPGDTLAVEFLGSSPQVQNDTYAFPSTVDGNSTGVNWLGDQDVLVEFSIGLSVVVAPLANPGPGYSTPTQNCSQCGFSGTTIDFGQINSGGSVTATDVARATVVYSGSCTSGCSSWQLQVSASGDAQGISELSTEVDQTNGSTSSNDPTSASGSPVTYSALTSFTAMPSTPTTFASGPEEQLKNACSGSSGEWCTDTIQNYKVSVGTDTSSHTVVVTYTLVAN